MYIVPFNFDIDLAATDANAKCEAWITKEQDALGDGRDWTDFGMTVGWCNPPYSRAAQFITKAAAERLQGFLTVMLLPARTDTKAFHQHIYDATTWQARPGVEIRLLAGRLRFGGSANSAPFASMIVVFRP